ncbi:related to TFIIH basal transcription factor complex p34 subunit [Melanopsichium pennsylvanicum]|uniref:General transcription and DNA repair factor IIH subunit TFB4 n=2 Tax=Melanopsichium pennsylvanicum TaxID=63383 RepID=A0AAJ4XHR6_9BASI|nr:related to TFIIH basal transcription factor complex p34 subunit [Melanopsichium pennsylvanicum 4]SNX82287.1 related to TFIIH basal transcription factor complex p34 subunit [Melanopsichium pennsylvanicum]
MPAPTSQAKSTTEIANAGFSHIQSSKTSATHASPDFLVLVLDINPLAWIGRSEALGKGKGRQISSEVALEDALSAIMIMLNAHMAMQHENGLAIYAAAGTGTAQLLYSTASFSAKAPSAGPTFSAGSSSVHKPDANTYQHFKLVDDNLEQGIRKTCRTMFDHARQAQATVEANADNEGARHATLARSVNVGIVSALSQALCHLNRLGLSDATDAANSGNGIAATAQTRAGGGNTASTSSGALGGIGGFKSRILILSVTQDASTQYIPMMNCIFAAQKKGITIDVCKLFGSDTVFLQQASYLTSGTYFRLSDDQDEGANRKQATTDMRSSLVQTLLTTYLPSRSMRGVLNLPTLEEIDFRAACFCHRRIVDIGYICSVCLSLFCQPRPFCLTCRSRFPKDTLGRYENELLFIDDADRVGAVA